MQATNLFRVEYLTQWGWIPCFDAPEMEREDAEVEIKARTSEANGRRTYRIVPVPKPRIGPGKILYFDSEHAARYAAERSQWPTDRIIPYGLGWAVQLRISGPYLTREDLVAAT